MAVFFNSNYIPSFRYLKNFTWGRILETRKCLSLCFSKMRRSIFWERQESTDNLADICLWWVMLFLPANWTWIQNLISLRNIINFFFVRLTKSLVSVVNLLIVKHTDDCLWKIPNSNCFLNENPYTVHKANFNVQKIEILMVKCMKLIGWIRWNGEINDCPVGGVPGAVRAVQVDVNKRLQPEWFQRGSQEGLQDGRFAGN